MNDNGDTSRSDLETSDSSPAPLRALGSGFFDDISAPLALFILEHLHAQRGPLGGLRRRLAFRLRATAARLGRTTVLRRLALIDARCSRARIARELDGVRRLETRLKGRLAHHERRLDDSSAEGDSQTALETTLTRLDAHGSREKRDRIEVELVNVSRERERLCEELDAADAAMGDLQEALDLELARNLPVSKRRLRFALPLAVVLALIVAVALWRQPRPDLAAGQTRPLVTAREHAQACLLPGACAAVVAGVGVDERPLSTIERFDPRTRAFQTLPVHLPRPTFNHALVALDRDRCLITGGETAFAEPAHRQILLIDFAASTITEVGLMTYGRRRHKAALLSEGRVLIVGGEDDPRAPDHSTIEIFDVDSGSSRIVKNLPDYVQDFTLTRAPLCFLIVGGQDRKRRALATIYSYEPETDGFGTRDPLTHPRYDHTATLLDNGRVVVAGGFGPDSRSCATVEILNDNGAFPADAPSMSRPRALHCAAALEGGRLLVTGGAGGSSIEDEAEIFDYRANQWFPGGRLAESRNNHVMVELKPAVFLLAGGYAGRGVLRSAEIFVPRLPVQPASRPADR